MTVNEFLKENKPPLKIMAMEGLSVNLGRCAGMVEVYEQAKAENGNKYAVELCKERYGIKSHRRFYEILVILRRNKI